MNIFRRKSRDSRQRQRPPAERFAMSPNLEVALWSAERDDGTLRLHWALSRLNPNGAPHRTLRPEDVLELPLVLATLARGFAELTELAPAVRSELKELSAAAEKLVIVQEANGEDEEEKPGVGQTLGFGSRP